MKRFYFATFLCIFAIMTASAQLTYYQSIVGTWETNISKGTLCYSFDSQGNTTLTFMAKVKEIENVCNFNIVVSCPGTIKMMGKAISVYYNESAFSSHWECEFFPEVIEKSKTDSRYRELIDECKKAVAAMDKDAMTRSIKSTMSNILVSQYLQINYCKGKTLVLTDPRQERMEFTYVGPATLSSPKTASK